MQRMSDIEQAVDYYNKSEEEKDHSEVLASLGMFNAQGRCMYCNHCLQCPAKIDIASVNKYLDLVELDKRPADSVRQHYNSLGNTAKYCIECGACERRCPFDVTIVKRMKKAFDVFGK